MGMSCRGLTRVWIDLHLLVIPQFAVDHILYSSPPPYITAGVLQKKSPQKSSLSSTNWVKYTLRHQD